MFVVSKVIEVITQPGNLILFTLIASSLLLLSRRQNLGRQIVAALTVVLFLVTTLPLDLLLVAPLEDRFPQPQVPARVDGIVVLGGSVNQQVTKDRGQVSLNSAAERLTTMIELGRRHPEARLVFTGGSGSIVHPDLKEAPVVEDFLKSQGFDVARVVFEDRSRNTWENAAFTRALIDPKPDETWLLVTSAAHMPRSVGAFRAAGWRIVPYPVDYLTGARKWGVRFSLEAGLRSGCAALHEWIGMAYYRLRGWSDAFFPGPSDPL